MGEIFQNITLNTSDKGLFIGGAIIVIVLVLTIMYRLDSMPENYKKKRRYAKKQKMEDDNYFENQIDYEGESAEEKIQELFDTSEDHETGLFDFEDDRYDETKVENDEIPEITEDDEISQFEKLSQIFEDDVDDTEDIDSTGSVEDLLYEEERKTVGEDEIDRLRMEQLIEEAEKQRKKAEEQERQQRKLMKKQKQKKLHKQRQLEKKLLTRIVNKEGKAKRH